MKNLAIAAALLAGAVALWLGVNRVASFYGGLGSHRGEQRNQGDATAHVVGCTRHGPVSVDGFGYWWHCRATVVRVGHGTAGGDLGPSVAGPSDVGHDIAVRFDCNNDDRDCNYRSQWWGALVAVIVDGAAFLAVLVGFVLLYDVVKPKTDAR